MSMSRQRGAGLIEALIAVLVLSIGLLGMVGMQTASLKFEQTGWVRTALSSSLSSFADRIRANASASDTAYSFSRTYAAERASIDASATYLNPSKDCNAVKCTEAELAAYDILIWRRELNQQLPGAVGLVTPSGTKNIDLRYLVTVAWFSKDNLDGTTLRSPELCTATTAGIAARNCCPSALGSASALAGVQCANLEMIP